MDNDEFAKYTSAIEEILTVNSSATKRLNSNSTTRDRSRKRREMLISPQPDGAPNDEKSSDSHEGRQPPMQPPDVNQAYPGAADPEIQPIPQQPKKFVVNDQSQCPHRLMTYAPIKSGEKKNRFGRNGNPVVHDLESVLDIWLNEVDDGFLLLGDLRGDSTNDRLYRLQLDFSNSKNLKLFVNKAQGVCVKEKGLKFNNQQPCSCEVVLLPGRCISICHLEATKTTGVHLDYTISCEPQLRYRRKEVCPHRDMHYPPVRSGEKRTLINFLGNSLGAATINAANNQCTAAPENVHLWINVVDNGYVIIGDNKDKNRYYNIELDFEASVNLELHVNRRLGAEVLEDHLCRVTLEPEAVANICHLEMVPNEYEVYALRYLVRSVALEACDSCGKKQVVDATSSIRTIASDGSRRLMTCDRCVESVKSVDAEKFSLYDSFSGGSKSLRQPASRSNTPRSRSNPGTPRRAAAQLSSDVQSKNSLLNAGTSRRSDMNESQKINTPTKTVSANTPAFESKKSVKESDGFFKLLANNRLVVASSCFDLSELAAPESTNTENNSHKVPEVMLLALSLQLLARHAPVRRTNLNSSAHLRAQTQTNAVHDPDKETRLNDDTSSPSMSLNRTPNMSIHNVGRQPPAVPFQSQQENIVSPSCAAPSVSHTNLYPPQEARSYEFRVPPPSPLPPAQDSQLHQAARAGDVTLVKELLAAGGVHRAANQVSSLSLFGPLHCAAIAGHAQIVRLLLEAGVNPNTLKKENEASSMMTPLHCAAIGGFADVADELLKAGADINVKTSENKSVIDLFRHGRNPQNGLFFSIIREAGLMCSDSDDEALVNDNLPNPGVSSSSEKTANEGVGIQKPKILRRGDGIKKKGWANVTPAGTAPPVRCDTSASAKRTNSSTGHTNPPGSTARNRSGVGAANKPQRQNTPPTKPKESAGPSTTTNANAKRTPSANSKYGANRYKYMKGDNNATFNFKTPFSESQQQKSNEYSNSDCEDTTKSKSTWQERYDRTADPFEQFKENFRRTFAESERREKMKREESQRGFFSRGPTRPTGFGTKYERGFGTAPPQNSGRDNHEQHRSNSFNCRKPGAGQRPPTFQKKTTKESHYDVLGVRKAAAHDDITKAYRAAALKWHPDR